MPIEADVRKEPIRIKGIDTPEKGQPGYSEAKKALEELLKDERVTLTPVAIDKYGRIVAKVRKGNTLVSTIMKKYQKK
jgi:endonuclease YncB( thermonuclease family)